MDLIDRQAAIDALDEIESEVADGYGYQYAKWRKYFVEMPSAQPEIIHCEECMYRNNTGASVRWLPCMKVATGDYWFCGSGKRAERREE